jgi:DNA-binding MarR family transcriptional regulator
MSAREETDTIELVSDRLHRLIWRIRLDQLGTWSKTLRGMAQLDLHILKLIAERPDIILREICAELRIPNSTLTSAINRLEKRGLLRRLISQRDRRSYGLELSEEGWHIKREHDRIDQMIAQKVVDALDSEAEAQTLIALLEKISQQFNEQEPPKN